MKPGRAAGSPQPIVHIVVFFSLMQTFLKVAPLKVPDDYEELNSLFHRVFGYGTEINTGVSYELAKRGYECAKAFIADERLGYNFHKID